MRSKIGMPVLAAALALASNATLAQTVGMATSPAGSFYHTMGSALAATLAEKGKVEVRIQPFSSANIHLPAINAGQVAFGLANIYELLLALQGGDFYKGRTNPNLRLVTITSPLRSAFWVKKDSPIQSIADLKGKRVAWGYSQQNIVMPLILAHFDAAGLKESDVTPVPVPTVVRNADDFMAGRNDVLFFAMGSAKVTEVDAAVGGIRALPLPDSPQTQASFKKNFPPAYIELVSPRPGLTGIATPTPIMTYDGVMVTYADAPEDLVYNVVKTLHDNAASLAKATPTLSSFRPATMAKKTDPIAYHPGAIKFYKEKGLWPPK
ncbi:MAG: TAXI family TRAP transporter solute-binding subunit [Proteobacteria bacterium]|nr:TAXI family TRAP transporter solute-binding subunit [Pseudomonadota bacterium]